ncbi:ferredoxin [Rothia nasimurium]|uniref:ferredoxin n=1 Tax=Rothia nasimurium TaxID=85336 RepID=UPI001F4205D4|nr:ferredoxin [Rothia nasimurium]
MTTTLHINWGSCAARGLCIELLEEKFTADPWGYPYSPEGSTITIPTHLEAQAREAAAACPLRALTLHTTPTT